VSKGHILVISGPSGVGKGTVVRTIMERDPNLRFSVSATTRERRPSETDGVNYFFVSTQRFEQMIANGELLEYACYVRHYYGTPEKAVDEALEAGHDVVLEIDVQGALQVKKRRPDAILVFIAAPSFPELARRLSTRGDTPPEVVEKRLAAAREEYAKAREYDYIVVNDKVQETADQVLAILTAQRCKAEYRSDLLKEVF
jgi:guanylate kinase